jgi:hypothetical protein
MARKYKELPSAELLRSILSYDENTGVLTWKSKLSRKTVIDSEAGTVNLNGYRQIQIQGQIYMAHRVAYKIKTGIDCLLDHRDLNRLNNAFLNLRPCSESQNNMNRSIQSNNTTGFKGVSFHKGRNQYLAYAKIDGVMFFGGWHSNAKSAAASAENLRKKIHGDFNRNG